MILVTGYTGNTGTIVLKKLLEVYNENEIIGIARNTGRHHDNLITYNIDLSDSIAVDELFKKHPIKSIIHIANIRFSPLILEKANEHCIEKVVLIHTTGVYSKYRSYSALYKKIEADIINKSYQKTSYIILRPTMIYGNQRDHNMHKLIKFLNRSPIFPIFGNGTSLMQPVHVDDLATAIFLAHQSRHVSNEDFDLSGGTVLSYKKVLSLISDTLEKKIIFLFIPIKLAIFGARILKLIMKKKPIIKVEQVERLQEDKAYSNDKAVKLLGFNPRSFEQGIKDEIKILKNEGIIK